MLVKTVLRDKHLKIGDLADFLCVDYSTICRWSDSDGPASGWPRIVLLALLEYKKDVQILRDKLTTGGHPAFARELFT